jgi:hypothetical protein
MKLVRSISPDAGEDGGAVVEAAVALPLFLGIVLAALYLLFFCFQMLRFQYDVAESTRETFTRNSQARGDAAWGTYLIDQLNSKSRDLSLPPWNLESVTFSGCSLGDTPEEKLATCGQVAQPGESVSLVFKVTQEFGLNNIGGITLPNITFRTKAVAVIQMTEAE